MSYANNSTTLKARKLATKKKNQQLIEMMKQMKALKEELKKDQEEIKKSEENLKTRKKLEEEVAAFALEKGVKIYFEKDLEMVEKKSNLKTIEELNSQAKPEPMIRFSDGLPMYDQSIFAKNEVTSICMNIDEKGREYLAHSHKGVLLDVRAKFGTAGRTTPCKFGGNCKKPSCGYWHPGEVMTINSGINYLIDAWCRGKYEQYVEEQSNKYNCDYSIKDAFFAEQLRSIMIMLAKELI